MSYRKHYQPARVYWSRSSLEWELQVSEPHWNCPQPRRIRVEHPHMFPLASQSVPLCQRNWQSWSLRPPEQQHPRYLRCRRICLRSREELAMTVNINKEFLPSYRCPPRDERPQFGLWSQTSCRCASRIRHWKKTCTWCWLAGRCHDQLPAQLIGNWSFHKSIHKRFHSWLRQGSLHSLLNQVNLTLILRNCVGSYLECAFWALY